MPLDIAPRHGQRVDAEIERVHLCIGRVAGHGQGNRPAARTHIGDGERFGRTDGGLGEHLVDEHLGFGPRDEHTVIDVEVDPVELPMAHEVGHGLACNSSHDQLHVTLGMFGRQFVLVVRKEPAPLHAQHMRQDHLGVKPRRRDTGFLQALCRRVDRRADLHAGRKLPFDLLPLGNLYRTIG